MLTSKQRAKLRGIASTRAAMFTVGKDGLTESVLKEIDNALHAHELVKVSVLDGAGLDAGVLLKFAATKLSAEEVCSIGKKFIVYRRSNKKGVKHIEF